MININVSRRFNRKKNIDMYGGSVNSNSLVTMDEIVDRIYARCTVQKPDIIAVLAGFQQQAIYALRNAQGVSLGELGTLYLRAKTKTVPTAKDFTADKVLALIPSIRPRRSFITQMQAGQEGIAFSINRIQSPATHAPSNQD